MSASLGTPSPAPVALAALLPVLLGGAATYFRVFIVSQKDFRSRIDLKRSFLLERVATLHSVLLNHARSIDRNDLLRGDGRNEPDLVGDYTAEVFRLFTVFHRLEVLKLIAKTAHYVLFCTIALGLAGLIAMLVSDKSHPYVFWGAVAVVVVQLLTILVVLLASGKLEQYEDVT